MQETGKANSDQCLENLERAKYERVWGIEAYGRKSPAYHRYFDHVKKVVANHQSVIEFGVGAGYALKYFADNGHKVMGVDIAENCLRVNVPLCVACLWNPMGVRADVGYCVDVLEHIPTHKVKDTIRNIMECVPKCLFIACMLNDSTSTRDTYGTDPLHLTVRDRNWWKSVAMECGELKSFSSDHRSSIFVLERQ